LAPRAWSVSPRYRFTPVMRTRSGLVWRTHDHTYFFFDHLGCVRLSPSPGLNIGPIITRGTCHQMKYVLIAIRGWEEGRLKPWESFEWRFPDARSRPPLSLSPQLDPFAASNLVIVNPRLIWRAPTEDAYAPPSSSASDVTSPDTGPRLHGYPSDLWPV
jgi:hypothetical protein